MHHSFSRVKWTAFSELTAVSDDHSLLRLTTLRTSSFHSLNNFESLGDLAEDGVLSIEVRSVHEGDEELGAVGVLASVGHGEEAWGVVLVDEVLVVELGSID